MAGRVQPARHFLRTNHHRYAVWSRLATGSGALHSSRVIGFTAPWALAGLAAAGIPLLLHLFARREPPTVVFPATRYLAETARAHHRRLTLQHWILLLIRTLLIGALAFAAAGPTIPSGGVASHAPMAIALILDNSASSGATVQGTPVLEELRRAAGRILDDAHAD